MSTANKSLAKSLHTISVLVNVAKVFQFSDPDMAPRRAIVHAMTALGYLGAEDPHGLVEKAVVALTKDQPEPSEEAKAEAEAQASYASEHRLRMMEQGL